ncbi:MAG: glycerate kinase [Bacteroidales bacterium]
MEVKLKILIVTDKFKGSLTALEAAESIKNGLLRSSGDFEINVLPMADGGDGTIDVIRSSAGGELKCVKVLDPLKKEVFAHYLAKDKMVFIEMAKCSGLQLLTPDEYNPLKATTYGLGQMILAAAGSNVEEIILGIGGSATNDGGLGVLRALGYKFTGRDGKETANLAEVAGIDGRDVNKNLGSVKFKVACDVNNPLLGKHGATRVYGPQKGADSKMVEELESGMKNWAGVCEQYLGKNYANFPGAGAAGGTGFALMGFLKAEMLPGWRVLSEVTDLERRVERADLVITGEGSVDQQSISGKLIDGVAAIAKKYSKPLWVYCGINNLTKHQLKKRGIERLFSISDIEKDKSTSMKKAKVYLEKISYNSATFLTNFQSNRQTD